MEEIKNLIFDVGGVLIGYRWQDMLMIDRGLDSERAMQVGMAPFNDESWSDFDAGRLSIKDILKIHKEKSPDLYEDLEWFLLNNHLMKKKRPKVAREVKRLKEKGYNIYILSNYSEELFSIHTDGEEFWDYVDGRVVSYELGKLKPQIEIYQAILEKYNLSANECMFFDDRKENVEGAESAGIKGFLVLSEDELIKELKKY